MSIQSEITRISGNVSSALSAIADKGVSVPEGANSDSMAMLINEIPTGSSIDEISADKVTAGTFAGMVKANAAAMANLAEPQVRDIVASTTDLTAGTSSLTSGQVYLVYE